MDVFDFGPAPHGGWLPVVAYQTGLSCILSPGLQHATAPAITQAEMDGQGVRSMPPASRFLSSSHFNRTGPINWLIATIARTMV